jgi:hypothetical protein
MPPRCWRRAPPAKFSGEWRPELRGPPAARFLTGITISIRNGHRPRTSRSHKDLELDTLFSAIAGKDQFILEVAKKAISTAANDLATIEYRQGR